MPCTTTVEAQQLLPHLDAAGAELVIEQRQDVVDDGVEIDRAAVDLRGPGEIQQAVDDLGGAERLALDLLEHLGPRVVRHRRPAAASA